ncbi:hypothetical protein TNCT_730491 [Trichonephila clavata]|uniref:Uncharacterized protein n=1 Tax=Trichonephila clavata TaxID=2740835 RepID=A0A8X6LZ62_TRICU|nr:hypothetical protein TNCT_730491 [Trichonephila clavata]
MNGRPEASCEEEKCMDTDSVESDATTPLDPESQCALIRAQEKEISSKEARLSYINNILLIECKDPRNTSTSTVRNLDNEKQDIISALQRLQGELSTLLSCHVPDCDHNLKVKNLSKRMAETYIQPPKFISNTEEYPALPGTSQENNNQKSKPKNKATLSKDDFVTPMKFARKPKSDDSSATCTSTQNKFSALAGAQTTDLDQTSMPVADKIPPPYGSDTKQTSTYFCRTYNVPTPPQQTS